MAFSMLLRMMFVSLLTMAMPALALGAELTGTVSYRERIALPPDAWLRVTLVELGSGNPIVGASAGIPTRGQVPIAFTLDVHSELKLGPGTHGLLAEISSGGRVLFRNPVPVPAELGLPASILVNYAPQPVVDSVPSDPAPDLIDIVWTVTSIAGRPVSGARPLTLSISADHRAGGSGGCNSFFTEASIDQNTLAFSPAAATRMACDPAVMEQETDFFAALAATASYEREGDGLRLLDAAGIPLVGLVHTTE